MSIVQLAAASRVHTHPGVPSWAYSSLDSSSCATFSIALANLSFFSSLLPCLFLASNLLGWWRHQHARASHHQYSLMSKVFYLPSLIPDGALVIHAGFSRLALSLFGFFVALESFLWVPYFFAVPFDLSFFWRITSVALRSRILVSDSDFEFHLLRRSRIRDQDSGPQIQSCDPPEEG